MELCIEPHPDPRDVALLDERVSAETVSASGHDDARELAVFVRDGSEIRAGIYGWTWGGCCELVHLWVDPSARGRGVGRALLAAAESEAERRGCGVITLLTHDAQAPGLYPRLGYELAGRVDGYPAGGAALWYRKPLGVASA